MKLGEDVTTLRPLDAVLIPPPTPRALRNDSDEQATLLMASVKVEDHRTESQGHEGFWPDASTP